MAEPINSIDEMTSELIKSQEGWSATSYKDARGHSIGYGHFIKGGEEHLLGAKLSSEEGELLLQKDIREHQQPWIGDVTKKLKPTQLAALTSFAYNVGPTAVRTLLPYINSGDYESMFNIMRSYRKSAGEINPALVRRREFEINLFNSEVGEAGNDPVAFLGKMKAANRWQMQKGVLASIKEKVTGKTARFDTASFDADTMSGQNEQVLSGLKQLAARLNAGTPHDIDEMAWAARVREEGRGW